MELALPDSADFPQDPALVKSDYALTSWQIFRACMEREVLLVDRNRPLYVIRFIMLLVLALVTATLFIRTRMKPTSVVDGNLYFGGLLLAPFRKTLAGLAHSPKEIAWQGWWGGEGGGVAFIRSPMKLTFLMDVSLPVWSPSLYLFRLNGTSNGPSVWRWEGLQLSMSPLEGTAYAF